MAVGALSNINAYKTVYFSGSQARIYINDYLAEEVTQIDGSYSYAHYPIYGYRSKHFDAVASGRVLVSGNLMINYISSGYLYAFAKALMQETIAAADTMTDTSKQTLKSAKTTLDDLLYNYNQQITKPPEQTLLFDQNKIKELRNNYWGIDRAIKDIDIDGLRPEFVYGPYTITIRDFKIGNTLEEALMNNAYEERVLLNVFLTDCSTTRNLTGDPVAEVYSFIAQTMI